MTPLFTAQTLTEQAKSAYEQAVPDEPSHYDMAKAWEAVGAHLVDLIEEAMVERNKAAA